MGWTPLAVNVGLWVLSLRKRSHNARLPTYVVAYFESNSLDPSIEPVWLPKRAFYQDTRLGYFVFYRTFMEPSIALSDTPSAL